MIDIHNRLGLKRVVSPISQAGNTAMVGAIIDRQGFDALEYTITLGTITTAGTTYTPLLEESDASNMAGATTVAAADLNGTIAAASFVDSEVNTTKKLGYKGNKRYTRLTLTPAGNTGASTIAATAILAGAAFKPVA
ncbi:MAG: hypothetical protein ABJA84_01930 [Polaromonas sp.]